MLRKIRRLFLFLGCLQATLFAEGIQTSLSHRIVGVNESLTLTFSSSDNFSDKPDFSLLEADFNVLSNTQGHQTTIINGKMDQERRWTLVLLPKREGNLTIPAIPFGQQQSQPQTIEVTAAKIKDVDDDIFLETTLEPEKESYEQAQLVYTVRLYRAVNISQATLSEVKVNDPDAIIEQIGTDREYEHYQPNGKRYAVLERKYAVFPQHKGELVFSPIIFQGRVHKGRMAFFDLDAQIQRAVSQEEKVSIKPIPAPFQKSNWIAAHALALVGEWSADPSHLTLGEPVTWTLTLTAEGCLGNQIPDLAYSLPANIRQYPDKPQVSNQLNERGIVGVKQTKIALIPSERGEITIPEISFKWWDIKSDQMKEAKLPATTLHIEGGAVAMNEKTISGTQETTISADEPVQPAPAENSLAWWLAFLNLFWIGALGYILGKRNLHPDPLKQIKNELKLACAKNDPKQAESALLAWAGQLYSHERHWNLLKLKQYVSEPFQVVLSELYTTLYSKKGEWEGSALWQAFSAFKPKQQSLRNKRECLLKDLYPN